MISRTGIISLTFSLLHIIATASVNIKGKDKYPSPKKTITYSNWSIGFTAGPLFSYRWLYDNPRFKSGEPPEGIININSPLPFDDKKFIDYRNKYEKIRWGSLWGMNLEYKINNTFSLQSGYNLYGIGEKIYTNTISESEYKEIFGGISDTIRNTLIVREFPIILKYTIAPHTKHDLKLNNSFLTYNRHLIGSIGVGIAKPVLNRSYYESYIHFGEGNTMVNAIAGIGISQQLSKRFNLTLSSVFRYSFTPAIEYSSINEFYYTLGLEANLRYQFAQKTKKGFLPGKSFECFDPRKKPDKTLIGPRVLWGFISGVNMATLWGEDAKNADLGQYDAIDNLYEGYDEAKGGWRPKIGPHAGLHVEYNFAKNAFALAADLMYSQKGFNAKYTYTWTNNPSNNEYMNTLVKVKLDYFEEPIYFKVRIMPQNYLLIGGLFAGYLGDKILVYYQHFNDEDIILGTTGTDYNYGSSSFSTYFYSNQNIFLKGLMLGYELNIDENVDLDFRIQTTDQIAKNHYKLFNITGQVSLIYMFKKREKGKFEE